MHLVNCPARGSDATQKLSMIQRAGTTQTAATMSGSFGDVSAEGVHPTDLAALASRLEKLEEPTLVGIIVFVVAAPFVAFVVTAIATIAVGEAFLPVIGLGVILLFLGSAVLRAIRRSRNRKWNRTEFPRKQAEWERTYLCHRCGEAFLS